jgi:hypothetical protein
MTIKRAATMILAIAYTVISYAVPVFTTKRLATIASYTGLDLHSATGINLENDSTWKYNGRSLRVCTNTFGEISHIGYKMFSKSAFDSHNNCLLPFFIERYALELDLKIDERDIPTRMAVDKVFCGQGNIDMLTKVTPQTPFSIEEIERRMYRIKWDIAGKTLSLTIPADCQLIIGADAIELENIFERNIKNMPRTANYDVVEKLLSGKAYHYKDQLIIKGEEYLSSMIRNDLYIEEKEGKKRVMIDKRKPVQTVTNILITGVFDKEIPMTMTLNRYGYSCSQTDITLQQFINLCYFDECKLYVGIKTHNKEYITATVFALNNKLAYNHVLSLKFPLELLNGSNNKIEATAYAYIPLQNVNEKFFTQSLEHIKINTKK